MSNDKVILYNMLSREVDNIISGINPALGVFSNTITNYIIKYIDPYVDMFFMGTDNLNTEAAGKFISSEVDNKVQKFIKDFKAARIDSDMNNEL